MVSETCDKPNESPQLEWLEGDVPRSPQFQDTYFSMDGGLEETRHVFLDGNRLPDRWVGQDRFTIGELGFGTGLNFLTTLLTLSEQQTAPKLTFLSFELYPLSLDQLAKALAVWPQLSELSTQLLANWQPSPGWNRWQIAGHELLLGIGDARQLMQHAGAELSGAQSAPSASVDAWYLDGFAPSRNPELWQLDLLQQVCSLTTPGGTLATYTAAGWVRRNLSAAGFTIEKTKGFSGKREMVIGRKPD
ncbi:tRNA (5-methylaminomethyl-2-thiouridine)(34)-methyltransferase MnmD [Roseibium limicola]|uniref:tRNA (5-methylaminomethyl-2-thiouridine)(34)-methyltransferase MnmD n=1 Tax=Roseibium limicola TaxID=2816037 RepID=A0A939EPV0_9HYPH|nr:tRNA (5-methylaminomethyl-2-thiouridine)(34)-methyltransferase MnmD [Roseibium limicola]MBO0345303.1 tRNA (5-methylaminomethyl-2-thiouridine)(34)-methyltransferase MnmD [Roseibium limicola]